MSEYTYTGANFAQAHFAIDPSGEDPADRYWARWYEDSTPWCNGRGEWASDDGMVERLCIPVYAEPYSPEALQRAWEHGEKPEPDETVTEGMVTLLKGTSAVALAAYTNGGGDQLLPSERIIYRPPAPEPDPVGDLAAALTDWYDRPLIRRDQLAELLCKHGMRVVTDDE